MSAALQITAGARGSDDPTENTAAHAEVLSRLNAEAQRLGWRGSAISFYRREDGYVSISIVAGDRSATLDDVRAFRDAQRRIAEVAEVQAAAEPAQKGLFG